MLFSFCDANLRTQKEPSLLFYFCATEDARTQTFAGCQFLTVEALATSEYSAVGFYERCGFTSNEVRKPYKDTLRMFRTLYANEEDLEE